MKFSVGDLVIEKDAVKGLYSYPINKIIAIMNDDIIATYYGNLIDDKADPDPYVSEPGSRSWRESFLRFQEEELFTLDEVKAEVAKLEATQSILDARFEVVRKQISAKMEQASLLVKEASELAGSAEKTFYNLKQECMPLYQSLTEGGWSHSHMRC